MFQEKAVSDCIGHSSSIDIKDAEALVQANLDTERFLKGFVSKFVAETCEQLLDDDYSVANLGFKKRDRPRDKEHPPDGPVCVLRSGPMPPLSESSINVNDLCKIGRCFCQHLKPLKKESFAALVVADVSDFSSKMSALMKSFGLSGVETFSMQIKKYFDGIIQTAVIHKGDVVRFSGDSMVICWRPENEDIERYGVEKARIKAACYAFKCSVSLLNVYGIYHTDKDLKKQLGTLKSHICMSTGQIYDVIVGVTHYKWESFVSGTAVEEVCGTLCLTKGGELSVTQHSLDLIKDYIRIHGNYKKASKGNLELCIFNGNVSIEPIPNKLDLPIKTISSVEDRSRRYSADLYKKFVNDAAIYKLEMDVIQSKFFFKTPTLKDIMSFYELRDCTCMLFNLNYIRDWSDERTLDDTQKSIEIIFESVKKNNGVPVQFGKDDKGMSALVLFGLPLRGKTSFAQNALNSGLEIKDRLLKEFSDISAGITSGKVFICGSGNTERVQYCVLGNSINLCARLMCDPASTNTILCDEDTFRLCYENNRFGKPIYLNLKGFSNSIRVFELLNNELYRDFNKPVPHSVSNHLENKNIIGLIEQRRAVRKLFYRCNNSCMENGPRCLLFYSGNYGGLSTLYRYTKSKVKVHKFIHISLKCSEKDMDFGSSMILIKLVKKLLNDLEDMERKKKESDKEVESKPLVTSGSKRENLEVAIEQNSNKLRDRHKRTSLDPYSFLKSFNSNENYSRHRYKSVSDCREVIFGCDQRQGAINPIRPKSKFRRASVNQGRERDEKSFLIPNDNMCEEPRQRRKWSLKNISSPFVKKSDANDHIHRKNHVTVDYDLSEENLMSPLTGDSPQIDIIPEKEINPEFSKCDTYTKDNIFCRPYLKEISFEIYSRACTLIEKLSANESLLIPDSFKKLGEWLKNDHLVCETDCLCQSIFISLFFILEALITIVNPRKILIILHEIQLANPSSIAFIWDFVIRHLNLGVIFFMHKTNEREKFYGMTELTEYIKKSPISDYIPIEKYTIAETEKLILELWKSDEKIKCVKKEDMKIAYKSVNGSAFYTKLFVNWTLKFDYWNVTNNVLSFSNEAKGLVQQYLEMNINMIIVSQVDSFCPEFQLLLKMVSVELSNINLDDILSLFGKLNVFSIIGLRSGNVKRNLDRIKSLDVSGFLNAYIYEGSLFVCFKSLCVKQTVYQMNSRYQRYPLHGIFASLAKKNFEANRERKEIYRILYHVKNCSPPSIEDLVKYNIIIAHNYFGNTCFHRAVFHLKEAVYYLRNLVPSSHVPKFLCEFDRRCVLMAKCIYDHAVAAFLMNEMKLSKGKLFECIHILGCLLIRNDILHIHGNGFEHKNEIPKPANELYMLVKSNWKKNIFKSSIQECVKEFHQLEGLNDIINQVSSKKGDNSANSSICITLGYEDNKESRKEIYDECLSVLISQITEYLRLYELKSERDIEVCEVTSKRYKFGFGDSIPISDFVDVNSLFKSAENIDSELITRLVIGSLKDICIFTTKPSKKLSRYLYQILVLAKSTDEKMLKLFCYSASSVVIALKIQDLSAIYHCLAEIITMTNLILASSPGYNYTLINDISSALFYIGNWNESKFLFEEIIYLRETKRCEILRNSHNLILQFVRILLMGPIQECVQIIKLIVPEPEYVNEGLPLFFAGSFYKILKLVTLDLETIFSSSIISIYEFFIRRVNKRIMSVKLFDESLDLALEIYTACRYSKPDFISTNLEPIINIISRSQYMNVIQIYSALITSVCIYSFILKNNVSKEEIGLIQKFCKKVIKKIRKLQIPVNLDIISKPLLTLVNSMFILTKGSMPLAKQELIDSINKNDAGYNIYAEACIKSLLNDMGIEFPAEISPQNLFKKLGMTYHEKYTLFNCVEEE